MKEIQKAIQKYIDKYPDAVIVGSFMHFNKEGEVVEKDSLMFGFGDKELVEISLDDINEELSKEKGDFVNW